MYMGTDLEQSTTVVMTHNAVIIFTQWVYLYSMYYYVDVIRQVHSENSNKQTSFLIKHYIINALSAVRLDTHIGWIQWTHIYIREIQHTYTHSYRQPFRSTYSLGKSASIAFCPADCDAIFNISSELRHCVPLKPELMAKG